MRPSRKRRLGWMLFFLAGISVTSALALNAFRSNLLFFFTPSQIVEGEVIREREIRVGGLVTADSVQREKEGIKVTFTVTDTVNSVPVAYEGILPDLFREGQGVVVKGRLDGDGLLTASEVLAKHDENYMPPEAAAALEAAKTLEKN